MEKKRFFLRKAMLYRAFPDQFTRMRTYRYGIDKGTEEVIVYQENCIHAQQERTVHITPDTLMCDIDENKNKYRSVRQVWGHLSPKKKGDWIKLLPYALVGIILVYAFASNGWSF